MARERAALSCSLTLARGAGTDGAGCRFKQHVLQHQQQQQQTVSTNTDSVKQQHHNGSVGDREPTDSKDPTDFSTDNSCTSANKPQKKDDCRIFFQSKYLFDINNDNKSKMSGTESRSYSSNGSMIVVSNRLPFVLKRNDTTGQLERKAR